MEGQMDRQPPRGFQLNVLPSTDSPLHHLEVVLSSSETIEEEENEVDLPALRARLRLEAASGRRSPHSCIVVYYDDADVVFDGYPFAPTDCCVWTAFCELLHEFYSDARSFSIACPLFHPVIGLPPTLVSSDRRAATLLRHLPRQLRKLSIVPFSTGIGDFDAPLMMRQIAVSFPQLEEVVLKGEDISEGGSFACVSLLTFEELANALADLPINRLTFSQLFMNDRLGECWDTLLAIAEAVGPRLESLTVDTLYHWNWGEGVTGGFIDHQPNHPEVLHALQCYPRVNQAKQHHFPDGNTPTRKEWVEAIIAVRDRVDCLDYFLTHVDPHIYAEDAILALGQRPGKRKRL